jgi:hypothetical protein
LLSKHAELIHRCLLRDTPAKSKVDCAEHYATRRLFNDLNNARETHR